MSKFNFKSRIPRYNDDSDYTTNAPSYYDDLARKQGLIKELAHKIWEYDKELEKRFKEWDKNLEEFDDEVMKLLIKWLEDGTLSSFITEGMFGFPLNIYLFKDLVTTDEEGRDDWSESMNRALELSNNILIPNIDNMYMKDIYIPSNTTIHGYKNQSTIKGFFHNDVGNYSDTIFIINGSENVIINNITFDGDLNYSGYVTTSDRDKVKNLIHVNNSKNITFNKCRLTNFVSNVLHVSNRLCWEGYLWGIMVVKYSENITLKDVIFNNSRLEGIYFYNTKNILIDNLFSINTYISTPLHAWYCDGFKLVNSTIYEDVDRGNNAGSVLNIYSKNMIISNNHIYGGTSIDLGNEAEDEVFKDFIAENIIIDNNIFDTCINSIGSKEGYQLVRNVKIVNNTFNTEGFTRAINTGNSENVLIENNTINGPAGIRYSRNYIKDLMIYNNIFNEVDIAIAIVPAGKNVTNIEIRNNNVNVIKHFIYFPYSDVNTGDEIVKDINIENNKCKSGESWFSIQPPSNSEKMYEIENVNIIDNNFTPLNNEIELGLYFIYMKDLMYKNNIVKGMVSKITLSFCENVSFINNDFYLELEELLEGSFIHFRETNKGIVVIENNEIKKGIENIEYLAGIDYNSDITKTRTNNNYPELFHNGLRSSKQGQTIHRPENYLSIGHKYFDTTLNKPIFWNGEEWVDTEGNEV